MRDSSILVGIKVPCAARVCLILVASKLQRCGAMKPRPSHRISISRNSKLLNLFPSQSRSREPSSQPRLRLSSSTDDSTRTETSLHRKMSLLFLKKAGLRVNNGSRSVLAQIAPERETGISEHSNLESFL